jgi:hypothetical protein
VADRTHVAGIVRDTLLTLWPGRLTAAELEESVSLGHDGLGLDSIEVVEVLLACDARCRGDASEKLLERGPVSIGGLVDHLAFA